MSVDGCASRMSATRTNDAGASITQIAGPSLPRSRPGRRGETPDRAHHAAARGEQMGCLRKKAGAGNMAWYMADSWQSALRR